MQCKGLSFIFIIYIGNYCSFGRNPGDISKTKCNEYSKYAKFTGAAAPLLIIGGQSEVQIEECGHKIVKRIVGGTETNPKEFPHMVVIGFEYSPDNINWLCGGTLISDQFVLTSAVCTRTADNILPKYVKLGVTSLDDNSIHQQQILISERIPYPEFKKTSYYHDIALFKLEKPVNMNAFARPACLYTKRDVHSKKAIATGWGATSFGGNLSNQLLKVTLDLYNHSSCYQKYQNNSRRLKDGIVDDIHFCAGGDDKDTCQRDLGGPLQIYHEGDDINCMYDIIGVTSFGKSCGVVPAVYTRVSNYIKWIEDIVWP